MEPLELEEEQRRQIDSCFTITIDVRLTRNRPVDRRHACLPDTRYTPLRAPELHEHGHPAK